MEVCHVGIDMAKAKFDVAARREGMKGPRRKRGENTAAGRGEFIGWLRANGFEGAVVCMEATGRYGEKLTEELHDAGFTVCVANPAQVKAFLAARGAKNKTDEADAEGILEFCIRMDPQPWTPPPASVRRLRELVGLREAALAEKIAWDNRIESGLSDEPAAVARKASEESAARIADLDRRIEELIGSDDDLDGKRKLLATIPGVGAATITALLAELPAEPPKGAKEAAAWAGLNPSRRESGTTVGRTCLSRGGNRRVKKAMYMAGLSASQHNPALKPFVARLRERGLKGKQVICAAARKLVAICCAVLRTGKTL